MPSADAIHSQLMEKVAQYGEAVLRAKFGTPDYDQQMRNSAAIFRQILDLSRNLVSLAEKGTRP